MKRELELEAAVEKQTAMANRKAWAILSERVMFGFVAFPGLKIQTWGTHVRGD